MHDDSDPLAGIDLAAWQPPEPPRGLADAVVARVREPASVAALDPVERPSRRAWWIGGLAGAAAIAGLAAWGLWRAPEGGRGGSGELVAAHPQHIDLDGATADLDAGAALHWQRDGRRIAVHQLRGAAQWTVAADDTLVIDSGAATIEATGARLRVEVQMNHSDVRLLAASSATAAAVAVVTAVVYLGHVKATSGAQTVNVTPGATVELRADQPPKERDVEPREPEPRTVEPRKVDEEIVVGAPPARADDGELERVRARLRDAEARNAALTAQIAALKASRAAPPPAPPPPAPAPAPAELCGTMTVDDIMSQAANQYSAGFAKAALALVTKALLCKQDVRMYRMAAMYACAAHDLRVAREMFAKVPPNLQGAIEQKCQQEGLGPIGDL